MESLFFGFGSQLFFVLLSFDAHSLPRILLREMDRRMLIFVDLWHRHIVPLEEILHSPLCPPSTFGHIPIIHDDDAADAHFVEDVEEDVDRGLVHITIHSEDRQRLQIQRVMEEQRHRLIEVSLDELDSARVVDVHSVELEPLLDFLQGHRQK